MFVVNKRISTPDWVSNKVAIAIDQAHYEKGASVNVVVMDWKIDPKTNSPKVLEMQKVESSALGQINELIFEDSEFPEFEERDAFDCTYEPDTNAPEQLVFRRLVKLGLKVVYYPSDEAYDPTAFQDESRFEDPGKSPEMKDVKEVLGAHSSVTTTPLYDDLYQPGRLPFNRSNLSFCLDDKVYLAHRVTQSDLNGEFVPFTTVSLLKDITDEAIEGIWQLHVTQQGCEKMVVKLDSFGGDDVHTIESLEDLQAIIETLREEEEPTNSVIFQSYVPTCIDIGEESPVDVTIRSYVIVTQENRGDVAIDPVLSYFRIPKSENKGVVKGDDEDRLLTEEESTRYADKLKELTPFFKEILTTPSVNFDGMDPTLQIRQQEKKVEQLLRNGSFALAKVASSKLIMLVSVHKPEELRSQKEYLDFFRLYTQGHFKDAYEIEPSAMKAVYGEDHIEGIRKKCKHALDKVAEHERAERIRAERGSMASSASFGSSWGGRDSRSPESPFRVVSPLGGGRSSVFSGPFLMKPPTDDEA